jgi:hypothetical protein
MLPTIRKCIQISKLVKFSYFPQMKFSTKEDAVSRNPNPWDPALFKEKKGKNLNIEAIAINETNTAATASLEGDYLRATVPENLHSIQQNRANQQRVDLDSQKSGINKSTTATLQAEKSPFMTDSGTKNDNKNATKSMTGKKRTESQEPMEQNQHINADKNANFETDNRSSEGGKRGSKLDSMTFGNETHSRMFQNYNLSANQKGPQQLRHDQKLNSDSNTDSALNQAPEFKASNPTDKHDPTSAKTTKMPPQNTRRF